MVKISIASHEECGELAVSVLDVDEAADLFSLEGLTASLRRAASFLCPASPRQLIDAVLEVVCPLLPDGGRPSGNDLADLLDLLVSAGDLLELRKPGDTPGRLLYLGPPSYIERQPGQYLLLGIRPFGAPLISSDLAGEVQYEGHTRSIDLAPTEAEAQLSALGFRAIHPNQWIRRPPEMEPSEQISRIRERISAAGPAGAVEGMTVIDPAAKVTYYRGRWRPLVGSDSGLFVARRPQDYGADLWCVVLVSEGTPLRLIDLPVDDPAAPGHDEAWRVQAALDAVGGSPQVFRTGPCSATSAGRTVDFFSPLPQWAERNLELAGMPVPRTAGALRSYRIPEAAIQSLAHFLTNMLWMRQITTEGRNDA
ncbi:hypothetical protein GCM10010182_00650 [Actinomadura cremea]|nr:hypothetical protein GCM10010182_00650 [Actinomadura cremea]